jgi:Putative peptidoglycan binding domain/L,D-transpeptidase catalytic domain
MRQAVRRWLFSVGAMTAVGVSVLGQGGIAAAASTNAPVRSAARMSESTYKPANKVLTVGAHSAAVRALQKRLSQLHYFVGKIDGSFGQDTIEAVWAFERVQGFVITNANSDEIGRKMERKLLHPRLPKVLVPRGGRNFRIEVNQATEVLVLYHHNKIELISHVSTGGGYLYPCPPPGSGTCGPAITPDGNYREELFLPGWVKVPLGEMFNPAFFIGRAYAIHGDTSVPWFAASHGCVRIPMTLAGVFHKLINIRPTGGTPVYIRGHI